MRLVPIAVVAAALAGATFAQDKRPAPEYFVETLMATTTAENVANLCPTLGFDANAAAVRSDEVLVRLAEDGHDAKNLTRTMEDPGDRVRNLQNAFLGRYGL